MTDVKKESQAGVALVAKAFQILDAFQADAPLWSQADMVRATGLNRSTVNRLMRYLAANGYLIQNAATGRYSLGIAAIDLGNRASASLDLRALCKPTMASLAAQCGETVVLSMFDPMGMQAICVDQIEGSHRGLRVFEEIGSTFPLHAGAAPKAILGFLPKEDQERVLSGPLEKFTEHTLSTPEQIRRDISDTIKRGYSVSSEETFEGTIGIAAPVLGPSRRVVASIAVAFPKLRSTPERIETIAVMVQDAARQVSSILSGEQP
jgi:DNA-binding IclR family transcriptional regulator